MAVDASVIEAAPQATLDPASPPMESAPTAAIETEATPAEPAGDAVAPVPEAVEATQSVEERVKRSGKSVEDLERGSRTERQLAREYKAHTGKAEADRKAQEDAAFQQRLNDALAERDKLAQAQAARDAADKAAREKFQKFFGSPEEVQELQRVASQLAPTVGDYDTNDEIAAKNKTISEINAARTRLNEFSGRWEMRDVVRVEERNLAWNALDQELRLLATIPGVDGAAYIAALDAPGETDAKTVFGVALESYAQSKLAPLLAENADLKADLEIAESELRAARAAAGGQALSPLAGGVGGGGGALTREQFLSLPKDQKDKVRREQPDLLAAIYARS